MLKYVEIKNRHELEKLETCDSNTIFITISDRGQPAVRSKAFSKAQSVCYEWFDDVDDSEFGCITDAQVNHLVEFIRMHTNSAEKLLVSCEGGISRSPAIAAVVLKYLGMNDMIIWGNHKYVPNLTVYKKLARALWGNLVDTPEFQDELKKKVNLNIQIWRKAQGID